MCQFTLTPYSVLTEILTRLVDDMVGRKPAGQKNFSASMKSNGQMATRGVPQVVVPGARTAIQMDSSKET